MAMSVVGEATTTEHFSLDARELFTTHRGRAILCAILFLVTLIIASPFITPFLFDKQDLINLVESKVFPVENSGPLALVEFVPVAALLSYGSAILGLRVTGANCKSRRMITALTVARWLVAGLMFESAYLHALTRFLAAIATVANVTAGAAGGSEESDAISSLIVYLLLYGAPVFLTSISAAVVWECQKPSSRFKIVRITKGRPIAGVISLIVMLPIAPVLIGIVSLAATSLIILVVAMVFTLILYLIAFAASARSDYRDM